MLLSSVNFINNQPKINQSDVDQLITLITQGEQEKAEEILKNNPELLLYTGTVTDLSGRKFNDITALQYALWALDWHMWKMLLKYLPNERAQEQIQQCAKGSWVKTHGETARSLIQNLTEAIEEYGFKCKNGAFANLIDAGKFWVEKVGGAQLLLPAHVINELCSTERNFMPSRTFTEETLLRTRELSEDDNKGDWFTFESKHGRLGKFEKTGDDTWKGFACIRGWSPQARCVSGADPLHWTKRRNGADDKMNWVSWSIEGLDLRLLNDLSRIRLNQRAELLSRFKDNAQPLHKKK